MPRTRIIFSTVVLIGLLAVVYVLFTKNAQVPFAKNFPSLNTTPPPTNGIPDGFSPFVSPPYNFGFLYPKKYYVSASELDATSTSPHLAAILVLDTAENRDALEGRSPVPRETPTGITVNVYHNPDRLPPAEWAPHDLNWAVGDGNLATTTVQTDAGVMYRWSGLYEGASVIFGHGDFIYVFAVSWESEKDPILADFDSILQSIRYVDAQSGSTK